MFIGALWRSLFYTMEIHQVMNAHELGACQDPLL